MSANQIVLISSEDERITVSREVGHLSELVKQMTEDEGAEQEVPLMDVKTDALKLVVKFCEHYIEETMAEIERPLRSENMEDVVSRWYADFVSLGEGEGQMSQEMLFELILAANYLDIKPLMDLSCAKVASLIKNKTPEQIREQFNIENDFTPEEEARVREENKWCEDL